jgi:hypothetical protein
MQVLIITQSSGVTMRGAVECAVQEWMVSGAAAAGGGQEQLSIISQEKLVVPVENKHRAAYRRRRQRCIIRYKRVVSMLVG